MADYINFWLAKAYVELIVVFGVLGIMAVIFFIVWFFTTGKRQ